MLGVDPTASMEEIRRSYLRLARASHPDFHNDRDDARILAETRMREINAAWAVLGDVDERSAYDRRRIGTDPPAARPFHARTAAHEEWQPFDGGPVEHFDEGADRPITSSSLPRWLAVMPAVLGMGGAAALVIGSIVNIIILVDAGLVSLLFSGLLFLFAPLFALSTSRRRDTRP